MKKEINTRKKIQNVFVTTSVSRIQITVWSVFLSSQIEQGDRLRFYI